VVTGGVLTVDEDMGEVWCLQDENRTHPVLSAVEREVNHLFPDEVAQKLLGEAAGGRKKTSAA